MDAVRPNRTEPPSAGGPKRLRTSASAAADGLHWRDEDGRAVAEPSPEMIRLVAAALLAEGLEPDGALAVVRHRPGDRGLPSLESAAPFGFALDLTEARRTLDGGLLLFIDAAGRATGWRAEAGALTLWSGPDPQLTELAPGAPERLTLIGRARPVADGASVI